MVLTVEPGQVWRGPEGGSPMQVVAVEGAMARVKRADSPKKTLANSLGAYLVAVSEFKDWTLVETKGLSA